RVHVRHRREVEVHPRGPETAGCGRCDRGRQALVVGYAQRHRSGRYRHVTQTHDPTALLVDGDDEALTCQRAQFGDVIGELETVDDVAAEQADSGYAALRK